SGESYMSEEICVGPILADAPVITHVTVDETDLQNGVVTVRWMEPFDADPVQFPPPYQYKVLRGEGFTGPPTTEVSGMLTALTFTDTGLNTENLVYNYAIVCYDNNGGIVDTSAVASTVRAEARSELQRIDVSWSASVPWSNLTADHPWHLVYRGSPGQTPDELVLIDSVNVTVDGFVYVDAGKFNNEPLQDDQTYCYRIMTRGSYGNPAIEEPLENFSQIVCAQPSDTIPPCQVAMPVSIDAPDCENYTGGCGETVFSNRIEWQRPVTGDCQN